MRVLVFGASITQGFWDTEGGWVNRIRRHYDTEIVKDLHKEEDYPTIFNLGISGDTTTGLLKRLENETKARQWSSEELVFIFSIGTNNAVVEVNGKEWSTPELYRRELLAILQKAKEFSNKILFVGLASCEEDKTTPVFWADIHYTNSKIFEFEKVMREVAKENHIPHVPIFEALQGKINAGEKVFADGLHPNNAGHELIYQLVKPELDKLIT